MGLVIGPVALLMALVWLATATTVSFLLCLSIRRLRHGGALQFIVFPAAMALCWFVPNIKGHEDQRRIDQVSGDCGWTTIRTTRPVGGVYAEAAPGQAQDIPDSTLLRIYGSLEVRDNQGRLHRHSIGRRATETSSSPSAGPANRTWRYGFRYSRTLIGHDIDRLQQEIMDFDTGEVLARHVSYYLRTEGPGTVPEYAWNVLTYQAKPCSPRSTREDEAKYRSVLPPVATP